MQIFLALVGIGVVGLFACIEAGGNAPIIFIGVFILGLLISAWVLSAIAKRQLDITVVGPAQQVAEIVFSHYKGIGWKQVDGRGDLNFRARGIGLGSFRMDQPVMSIDIEDNGDGRQDVAVWMSSWSARFGMVASCDRVVWKSWTLSRKLSRLSADQPSFG